MLQYKINDHYLIIKILTISNKFTKQKNKKIFSEENIDGSWK
jgi:hypothetical protein